MKNYKFLALTILAATTIGLGACETIEGAGRDIEHGGEAIQDAAN
jgi:predicted small secreted protein